MRVGVYEQRAPRQQAPHRRRQGGEGWPIPPLFVPRWSPAENEGSKPKPKYGFVEGKKRFQLCFVRKSPRALINENPPRVTWRGGVSGARRRRRRFRSAGISSIPRSSTAGTTFLVGFLFFRFLKSGPVQTPYTPAEGQVASESPAHHASP